MTTTRPLFVKYRSSKNSKIQSTFQQKHNTHQYYRKNLLKPIELNNNNCVLKKNSTMSTAFIRELDLKMQKVREYGLIAHGYHNENLQYPVHVRRSHDGEKIPRISKFENRHRKNCLSNPPILRPSSDENRTKIKSKELFNDEQQTKFLVPPNKTVNDINPSLICDNISIDKKLSSANSSPILCSSRLHSIIDVPISTDEQQINSLSTSSQSLISHSMTTKTLTKRIFSKLFHYPPKC